MVFHCGSGEILRHHADEEGAVDVRDHPHRARRVVGDARQHEVTHDDSFPHHPALVENVLGSLPAHLFQSGTRAFGIVIGRAVFEGESGVGIFQVGQPYIHESLEPAQVREGVRAVAVPHNRQFTARFIFFKCGYQPFSPRSGGDEVQVLRALFFEVKKEGEQFLAVHVHALAVSGYLRILAERAAHIAARKEDRAAAVFPRDAGFFEAVQTYAGDPERE